MKFHPVLLEVRDPLAAMLANVREEPELRHIFLDWEKPGPRRAFCGAIQIPQGIPFDGTLPPGLKACTRCLAIYHAL